MMRRFLHIIPLMATVFAAALSGVSCSKDPDFDISDETGRQGSIVHPQEAETRSAMILISAGFNDLSGYLSSDIKDLGESYLPEDNRYDDLVFVFSRQPSSPGVYSIPTAPVLIRMYRNREGTAVMDTVLRLNTDAIASSKASLQKVLTFIKDEYPAAHYGIVLSSHGTGWLPKGYFSDPFSYDEGYAVPQGRRMRRAGDPVLYVDPGYDPSLPAVKTICQDKVETSGVFYSYEMTLKDLADAIPMHLDYLLLDACLMGGVETAFEMKDVCDVIAFSQTEVLAQGFDYKTMTAHLLQSRPALPEKVCSDYYEYYAAQTGVYQSATISLIDCRKLDPLAMVCKELFEKYRAQIASVNPSKVQGYFRDNKHWFYDLKDILTVAGIDAEDTAVLDKALAACTLYKNATPRFMDVFPIRAYCGFSMYLPANGSTYLDNAYKELVWNQATALVK